MNNLSWDEAFELIQNCVKKGLLAKVTYSSYISKIKGFRKFSLNSLADITYKDIDLYIEFLQKNGRTPSYIIQTKTAINFLFKKINPLEYSTAVLVHADLKRKKIDILSKNEIKEIFKILKSIDPVYYLMSMLMYGCGLRVTECFSLRVSSIIDGPNLQIFAGNGPDRIISIPKLIIPLLNKHFDQVIELHCQDCKDEFNGSFMSETLKRIHKPDLKSFSWQFLFPSPKYTIIGNKKYRNCLQSNALQELLNITIMNLKIEKRVTQTSFRNSCCVHLLEGDNTIDQVRMFMGHGTKKTTENFLKYVNKDLKHNSVVNPLDLL